MAETVRFPMTLNEYTVVDTDVHLWISPRSVLDYVDPEHRAHVKAGIKPSGSWDRHQGGNIEQNVVESAEDIESKLCDQFSIDYPIINPSIPWLNRLPQPDLAVAVMRAYNDYLIERVLDEKQHFFGLLQVAPHQPTLAAEEIDRLGDESQIVGVYLVSLGAEAPLGDSRYDVIYDAADKQDLTITYHSGTNAFITDFPKQNQAFNNFLPVHVLGHLWGQMQTLVSLIVEGTPEKFPDLNFAFLEAGISWLPALMFKLNKEYSIRKNDAPLLTRQPEEYIRDFYLSSQPFGEPMNRTHMEYLLEIIDAPNSLMFSSDYPHWDFDNPTELFGYLTSMYSDDAVRKVLSGNAIDAYRLEV